MMVEPSRTTAIAHDWLIHSRGAERVLLQFCLGLPRASIYTLFYSPGRTNSEVARHRVHVSPLGRLPLVERYYRYLLPAFPLGVSRLKVSDVELLLSIHHSVAKAVSKGRETTHICYCLSPMRYLWETGVYGASFNSSLKGLLLRILSKPLKKWDLETNRSVDHFVAISKTTQERIQRCYGRHASVIYPSIDRDFFQPGTEPREGYYLVVSALVPQKRLDLVVEAFARFERQLVIVGIGPERNRLQRAATANVHFLGWRSDEEIRALYRRARALIFPGVEDFGLVPVEAQACGCPVLAFGKGGATETIREDEGGLFFREPTAESLIETVKRFESKRFDPEQVRQTTEDFSHERFQEEWASYLAQVPLKALPSRLTGEELKLLEPASRGGEV